MIDLNELFKEFQVALQVSSNNMPTYQIFLSNVLPRMTFVSIIFAYISLDIVSTTTAKSTSLTNAENMKIASQKTNIRIITLYPFAVRAASFIVPIDICATYFSFFKT